MNRPTASTTVIHAAITDAILIIFKLTTGFRMMYYCLVNCDDGDPVVMVSRLQRALPPGCKAERKETNDE